MDFLERLGRVETMLPEGVAPVEVLLVSPDGGLRRMVRERLEAAKSAGAGGRWVVREAEGGADALEKLMEASCDVLLLHAALPDLRVGEFRSLVGAEWPEVQVVMLPEQEVGGEVVREEAPGRLAREIEAVLRLRPAVGRMRAEGPAAAGAVGRMGAEEPAVLTAAELVAARVVGVERAAPVLRSWQGMVGASEAMQRVYRSVRLVARRDTSVLVQGESGTGKDLVAQAVHAASGRAKQPFVVINCAAIPEALLEAELFGYTKGAFTGAVQSRIGRIHAAHGGTLFLDEIGEMPLPLQSKLLRFLEQGEVQRIGGSDTLKVDVRVVAATNADLKKLAGAGAFREDLYYRLAVFPIRLPALRERMEDLPALVELFLERFAPGVGLSGEAWARLRAHTWPGNVRELRNAMERASLFAEGAAEIGAEDVVL